MKTLALVGDGWSGARVELASTSWDRWRGIRAVGDGCGLAINRRALHTIGLDAPLRGVGIDRTGTVIAVKLMRPDRFFYFRRSEYVVEFPLDIAPPALGTRVGIRQ